MVVVGCVGRTADGGRGTVVMGQFVGRGRTGELWAERAERAGRSWRERESWARLELVMNRAGQHSACSYNGPRLGCWLA